MVHTGFNPALVALSIGLAVFASYTALDLGARVRGPVAGPRWPWVAGAAVAMGGGIWSMHFVGMLAFEMGLPADYDLGVTLLSLVIAVAATGAGFAWVARTGGSPDGVLVAGPLMGLGVAGMHYTGMAALRIPGHLSYSPSIVAVSIVIAVTAATAALWLAFRQHGVAQKLVAACIMGIAVAGMHYTGMAAATVTASDAAAHAGMAKAGQESLAVYVAGTTFLILFLAMLASSLDQQRVQQDLQVRMRVHVDETRGDGPAREVENDVIRSGVDARRDLDDPVSADRDHRPLGGPAGAVHDLRSGQQRARRLSHGSRPSYRSAPTRRCRRSPRRP